MRRLRAMLKQRCPRCLQGSVFKRGMAMYYACPLCGVVYGRENGYFTGAMIVSYVLAAPIVALMAWVIWLLSGWSVEITLLATFVLFLPMVPNLFRYSRVVWMHFDRMVDSDPTSERYVEHTG
jgi:uncharacterized protein (DUF983 family)